MQTSAAHVLLIAALLIATGLHAGCASEDSASESPVPADASVELIAEGLQFTEGPYWRDASDLVFSDIPANKVYRWAPGEDTTVFLEPSGHSNGITADQQGRLLLAQHDGHLARVNEDTTVERLVSTYDGQRLNSPNDLDVYSDGSIYFTDPPYGVDEEERELDFSGVYRYYPDSDSLELLTQAYDRPNGITFSPDASTLYVNDSQETAIWAYDVDENGALSNRRPFATPSDTEAEGTTDGMKVDTEGNLYTTGPGGVWIYAPTGELLARIDVPVPPTNLAFGGPDTATLYITARQNVYRIELNTTGVR